MAPAFMLESDKQFISLNGKAIVVHQYKGDDMDGLPFLQTPTSEDHWVLQASIDESEGYSALRVFDVTIEGDKLVELALELRGMQELNILVNRLGLCVIVGVNDSAIRPLRINDYFGWSKYGVNVPRDMIINSTTAAAWNRVDMFSGETMVDVRGNAEAAGEAKELRRSLEEKSMELTICRKELERSRKNESLWSKLLEDKDEKLKMLENQLLVFKAASLDEVDG